LTDAAAQATAAMERDERACWLLENFIGGKILQRRIICDSESESAPS
jgi:hypothetical protein